MDDAPHQPRRTWARRLRRGALASLAVLALLLAIMLINTLTTPSRQLTPGAHEPLPVAEDAAVERLRAAIQVPTISHDDPAEDDRTAFATFVALLERSFPRVHASLERELIADRSLMYRWQGADPQAAPIVLTAHMDVVPPGELEAWTHPPFSGELARGYVWGRGTMDDKAALIAILEAVEATLAAGRTPPQTVYLCFGHDEETLGTGAQAMAARLVARGVEPAFVLDEGMGLMIDVVPGVDAPVAMVGLGEKGFATIELSVEAEGGHSSTPPEHTAIGILAAAITRLEAKAMPANLDGPFRATLEVAGPQMSWPLRLVATNLWLLRPVLTRILAADPTTASAVRTTTAVTMIEGGVKPNVLPQRARAIVNHRINYGDTIAGVLEHVRASVDDPRVEVELVFGNEVSSMSSADDPAYERVARALREVYPEVVVVPAMHVAASDARYYEGVARQVYRQSVFRMTKDDIARYHGIDERLAVEDFLAMIQFYARVIGA